LTGGVEKLINSNGGEVITGSAYLSPGPTLTVKRNEDDDLTMKPKRVIIASGSKPIELPGFPFSRDEIWNSKDAVIPPEIPDRLVILGAGVIGLEMGTIYSRLGTDIKVVEMQDSILPGLKLERRMASYMNRSLKKTGLDIKTETKAKSWESDGKHNLVLAERDGEEVKLFGDRVLVAVGRSPQTDFIDDDLQIEYDGSGFIVTDERCRTNLSGIYAIGDVAGEPQLAHKASREAVIAAGDISGETVSNYRVVPAAVFTDPEYAQVGLSTEEAREKGFKPALGRFPLRASGKALSMDKTDGAITIVVDEESDRILGGSILSPHASDMISEIALAIEANLTATEVAETIHPHPTLSEAIMEAAENVHGRAITTSNR